VKTAAATLQKDLLSAPAATISSITNVIAAIRPDELGLERPSVIWDLKDATRAFGRVQVSFSHRKGCQLIMRQALCATHAGALSTDRDTGALIVRLARLVMAASILAPRTTLVLLWAICELEDLLVVTNQDRWEHESELDRDRRADIFGDIQTAYEAVYIYATAGSSTGVCIVR
jgi:hypothetical protein